MNLKNCELKTRLRVGTKFKILMLIPAIAVGLPGGALGSESTSSSLWTPSILLRTDFNMLRLKERLPAPAVPVQNVLLQVNLSGKTEFLTTNRFQLDVDAFARQSWNEQRRDPFSGKVQVTQKDSENPQYRLLFNEIYLNGEPVPGIQYTAGKKRVLWGTGFAANPTDLVNPAKNPLDPTYERRGAWLVQAEHVQETQTVGVFFAPAVTENKHTIPQKVGRFEDPDGSERFHSLTAARWYQLLGGADVNLMIFLSERYRDQQSHALKWGGSWSQIATFLSPQLETHAEFLLQKGSDRPSSDGASRFDSDEYFLKSLVGFRYDFANESSLVFEYLIQTDGDTLSDVEQRLKRQMSMVARQSAVESLSSSAIVMRNFLFLNYQRYKFNDDLFLSWAIAHNPHDHSGYQGPILQWTPTQTLSLSLNANSDYNLKKKTGVVLPFAGRVRMNELNPVKSRIGLDIKSYF